MSSQKTLVLVLGDLHIPHRVHDLPAKFKSLLVPGKIQRIVCTGNVCTKEVYDYLRTICSDISLSRGDYDEKIKDGIPDFDVIKLGDFRVGLMHGHQVVPWGDENSLTAWQRKLDVDVLISGATHECSVFERDGAFFVNPGSATGAYSPIAADVEVRPTFVLMDVQGSSIVAYLYRIEADGEVKIKKREFKKQVV
nr:vacuolar protein sorting-associated protein 29 [Andalucia godoyi]|eukprot:ANDGO_02817.mRNA.1 Vacuolar protein sorting-associated protein 29